MSLLSSLLGPLSLKRRVVRDGFWVGIGQFIVVIASLVGMRLITEFVRPAILGPASLLLGMFTLGKGLLTMPVLSAEQRFYSDAAKHDQVWKLRKAVAPMLAFGVGIFTILALSLGAIWCHAVGISLWAVVILCAVMFLDACQSFETALVQMARRQRLASVLSVIESIARPTAIVLLAWLCGSSVQIYISGSVAAASLPLIFLLVFASREGLEKPPNADDHSTVSELRRQLIRFAIPLAPITIFAWVIGMSDRYIIEFFNGMESVGVYAATYGLISQAMMVSQGLLGKVLQPIYYKAVADGSAATEAALLRAWLCCQLVLSGIGLIGVLLFHDLISRIFLSATYRSGSGIMGWIAAGYAVESISIIYETRLYAHKQTSRSLYSIAVTAIFAAVIPLILVPRLGIRGAAIACPVYFAVMLVANVLFFRRTTTVATTASRR